HTIAQNHPSHDYVLQLADVARPIIGVEEFHGFLVDISNLLTRFLSVTVDQVADQQRNITNTLAQCRQSNRKNVETVKQVLTELAFSHRRGEVSIGSRYHPYVNRNCLTATHSLELPLLKNSQQCNLRLWRKITYFIKEYRSTIGRFETSQPSLSGPSEGAFFMSEQLGRNERRGNYRAVHSNESTV